MQVLTAEDATRGNILEGLDWLGEKLEQDDSENETALIYFSGHGHQADSGESYLIPYDMAFPASLYALQATAFAKKIASVKPRRLLVILDCCYAEALDVKGDIEEENIGAAAITPDTPGFSELA